MAKTLQDKLETKYIRDLKKEISKLKRENQTLRKKANRNYYDFFPPEQIEEPVVVCEIEVEKEKEVRRCPECDSKKADFFEVGLFEFYKCENCDTKGRVK